MDIQRYDTGVRMSRVVVYNGVANFCGHVADAKKYKTIQEQTQALLARYEELLEQYGSDKEHILTAAIYMKDIAQIGEMNEVWDKWVPDGCGPTRVCVQAPLAGEEYLVEIVLTAAVCKEIKG